MKTGKAKVLEIDYESFLQANIHHDVHEVVITKVPQGDFYLRKILRTFALRWNYSKSQCDFDELIEDLQIDGDEVAINYPLLLRLRVNPAILN